MKLDDAQHWFSGHGLPFNWRIEHGKPALLKPARGSKLPLGTMQVGVVIPDIHLGWGNDIFRYGDSAHDARFEKFLLLLVQLRAELKQLAVVQLGDWYDIWRTPTGSLDAKKAAIEAQYPRIVAAARALEIQHCIGNHDAAFYANPPMQTDIDVAVARHLGGPDILCFHGHDFVTLQNIVVQAAGQAALLNVVDVFATAVPILGQLAAWIQMVADRTRDPWYNEPTSIAWPPAGVGLPSWDAPWVARAGAVQVGPIIRAAEHAQGDHRITLAFLGHSHRPGISWTPVAPGHSMPLIDVGSWTYSRAEFALVCEDGVGLARLT